MSTQIHSPLDAKPSVGGVIKNGAIAGVIGVVVNAILYFIGSAMGAFPETVLNPAGQPITLIPVIMVTLIGAVAGTLGYLVLSRFMVKPLANRWFTIIAVVVLIAMAFTPFYTARRSYVHDRLSGNHALGDRWSVDLFLA